MDHTVLHKGQVSQDSNSWMLEAVTREARVDCGPRNQRSKVKGDQLLHLPLVPIVLFLLIWF